MQCVKLLVGYIETIFIGATATGARRGIVLNEEGKLHGLPFNKRIVSRKGGIDDVLFGNFFVTADNYKGQEVSLSDGQCSTYITARFKDRNLFISKKAACTSRLLF